MTPAYPKGRPYQLGSAQNPIIPDLTEPVLAYRHWNYDTSSGFLTAPYQHFVWQNGENVAYCETNKTEACGSRYCGCGFYGVYDDAHEYARKTSLQYHRVFGVIEAYGKVSLGSEGLRCEKAKIVALHVPFPPRWTPGRAIVNHLRRTYPDARFYRERSNLVTAEGVHRPTELWENRSQRAYG